MQPALFGDAPPRVLPAGEAYRCTQCGETKLLSEFTVNTFRPLGHQSYCKECARLNALRRRGALISAADFARLRTVTTCAICEDECRPHIDHCHVSGLVRGALCHRCNTGLGSFRDSSVLLARAINYLAGLDATQAS